MQPRPPPSPPGLPELALPAYYFPRIQFDTDAGKIFAAGEPFAIQGTTWSGAEYGLNMPPSGLDENSLDFYMTHLSSNGFNTIRLLFNHGG